MRVAFWGPGTLRPQATRFTPPQAACGRPGKLNKFNSPGRHRRHLAAAGSSVHIPAGTAADTHRRLTAGAVNQA